jgi:type III pantothenate kinase
LEGPGSWAIASVHPPRAKHLADWLGERRATVLHVKDAEQLPLRVDVESPNKVGIDRLLNAVAAKSRVQRQVPIVIIDAGSAVTVDCVDANGAFSGGAILPGLRLMSQALHEHTALLPLVEIAWPCVPSALGKDTRQAIEAGIFWAVAGGIKALLRRMPRGPHEEVFLTGGDASVLKHALEDTIHVWPNMTLEGIRQTAEALP